MDLTGQVILGFLEEDDSRRVLFRVRPLLSPLGLISPEDLEELEQDGYLRVAPDRQEQHSFKDRMRALGSLCLIDLRDAQSSLGKVRPNKHYQPGRGDSNRYIIYSDAVRELPGELVYEVVAEDKRASALTKQYYLRTGGRISGPHCPENSLSCPNSQTLMPDCDRLFLVEMPDGSSRMFYWPESEREEEAITTEEQPQTTAQAEMEAAPATPADSHLSQFDQAAGSVHKALAEAGFDLDEQQAGFLLLLCLLNSRVQLWGDNVADAHLAGKTLCALFGEGLCSVDSQAGEEDGDQLQLIYAQTLFVKRSLKRYHTAPWPVARLLSGPGFPALHPNLSKLDQASLLPSIRGACTVLDEQTRQRLTHMLQNTIKEGCALPLMMRAQMAEFLCFAQTLFENKTEEAFHYAQSVYALPYLQAKGYSADEAWELLKR